MGDWGEQQMEQRWASLSEVAVAYGVSIDTVRRRMKRGELEARRQQTPQGFKWLALMPNVDELEAPETTANAPELPQAAETSPPRATLQIIERDREELIETLRHELSLRNREVARLHEVIATQAKAIEATMAVLPTHAQTIEQSAPTATPLTVPEDAIEPLGTLWSKVRKWFAG